MRLDTMSRRWLPALALMVAAAVALAACIEGNGDGSLPGNVCPSERPLDGDRCDVAPELECMGAEGIETCSGIYGGVRRCTCEDGAWSCPNIFCPPYCPATLADARAGVPCDDTSGIGACYYDEAGDSALCSCNGGQISCGP
jgi:hypothetical protein